MSPPQPPNILLISTIWGDVRANGRETQIAYARCHIDWAKKNLETWREAREEVEKIEVR